MTTVLENQSHHLPGSHLGITGSREATTRHQVEAFRTFLRDAPELTTVHHGCCLGADAMAHYVSLQMRRKVECHPPLVGTFRCTSLRQTSRVSWHAAKPYMDRNGDIVAATWILAAFPLLPEAHRESKRSGTWATVRIARAARHPVFLFWPDGSVEAEQLTDPL